MMMMGTDQETDQETDQIGQLEASTSKSRVSGKQQSRR